MDAAGRSHRRAAGSRVSCKRVSARVPTRTNTWCSTYLPTLVRTKKALSQCVPLHVSLIYSFFAVPSCQCQVVRRQSHQNKPSRPWPQQRRLMSILYIYIWLSTMGWCHSQNLFPGTEKEEKKELGKTEAPQPPSVIFPGWPVPRKKRKRNTEYSSSQLPKLHFRDMHITTSPHPPARKTPLANNNRSSSSPPCPLFPNFF